MIDAVSVVAQKEWEALSDIAVLVKSCGTNREDFIKECRDGKFDGVFAAYSTLASRDTVGSFDRELVNVLPKSWKFLCHCGRSIMLFLPDPRLLHRSMPGTLALHLLFPSLLDRV
jgi:hypothetical protein